MQSFLCFAIFRRDSDIYFPYNTLENVRQLIEEDDAVKDVDALIRSKTKLAVWASGNCVLTKGEQLAFEIM